MQNDAAITGVLSGTVILFVLFTSLLSERKWLPQWLCRKILHIGAIGACAIAPLVLIDLSTLRIIVACIIPILFFLVKRGIILPEPSQDRSYGIPLFAVAFLILLLIIPDERMVIFFSMAVLAVCDALAGIAGIIYPKGVFSLTGDRKSITGSISFFLSFILLSVAVRLVFPQWLSQIPEEVYWQIILLFASFVTLAEAMGRGGWDNFFIPLIAAVLFFRLNDFYSDDIIVWHYTVLAAIIFCLVSIRLEFLSPGGAVMAGLIGVWIVIVGHYYFLFPLIFYFVSCVLIGKIIPKKSAASDEKQGKPRDWLQVLSNGGLYAVLMIGLRAINEPGSVTGYSFICAIPVCVAVSDTWASEIGSRFKGKVINIIDFKPFPAGISGGVSMIGTLSGLAGATIFAALVISLSPWMGWSVIWYRHFVVLALTGFAGMLIDSVLGSVFQAKYTDVNGNVSDKAAEGSVLSSGYKWMTNDLVNQLSILLTMLIFSLIITMLMYINS